MIGVIQKNARQIVLEVFKQLRKLGYLCKANYLCCGSCAGYSLTQTAVRLSNEGKTIRGCVFWHKQSDASYWKSGELYLAFGQLDSKELGAIGIPTKDQGSEIFDKLVLAGLDVYWNGDENTKIMVKDKKHVG